MLIEKKVQGIWFSEIKIAMRASSDKRQHKPVFEYLIHEQPIRLNVTLSVAFPVVVESMVPILRWKRFATRKL